MRNKRKTIGKMTKTRAMWQINPVTRVVPNKKKQENRSNVKVKLKKGDWD